MTNRIKQLKEEIGFLKLSEVLDIIPVSKATWYNGIRIGIYPEPIKLNVRSSAWRVSEIKKLCESF